MADLAPVFVRMDQDLRDRIDKFAEGAAERFGMRVTMSDAIRMLVKQGLDSLDNEPQRRAAGRR